MTEPDAVFPGNVVGFGRILRRAGLPISSGQTADFLRALDHIDIGVRDQVFHAGRSLLVRRREDLKVYDTAFELYWSADTGKSRPRGQTAPVAPRHDPRRHERLALAMFMASPASENDPSIDMADRSETYSSIEVIGRKHFSDMTPEELVRVKRLIAEMKWSVARRRTRRWKADRKGASFDLRKSLRDATKYGGVPVRLRRRRRKVKDRPVIVLADISGSMEQVSRLVLQFFYAMSRSLDDVEFFVFGTRLTRITSQLKIRNIDRAIEEASREVVDWGGGTRIGESLQTFNKQWSRRLLRRGAVVVVVSDGCDRGDAELLRRQMRYVKHRCHRLIWLNPLLGGRDYRPLVMGMATALEHVDMFLPIHNLQSLDQLAEALSSMSSRGFQRRSVRQSQPG